MADREASACSGQAHQAHLCSLARSGCFAEVARLEKEPRFVCQNCGRYARAAENLCTPEPLGKAP